MHQSILKVVQSFIKKGHPLQGVLLVAIMILAILASIQIGVVLV
jgi:hypothetical protein